MQFPCHNTRHRYYAMLTSNAFSWRADGQATYYRLVGKADLGEGCFFCVIGQFSGRCAHSLQTATTTTVCTDQHGAGNRAHHLCPWHQLLLVSHHHQTRCCQECAGSDRSHLANPVFGKHLVCGLLVLGQNNTSASI